MPSGIVFLLGVPHFLFVERIWKTCKDIWVLLVVLRKIDGTCQLAIVGKLESLGSIGKPVDQLGCLGFRDLTGR